MPSSVSISSYITVLWLLSLHGTSYAVDKAFGIFCVHCASPRSVLKKQQMLDAMDQLFDFRQSLYPYSVVNDDCAQLTNISKHQMQHCHYSICYSITFREQPEGPPLVVRGCAESFLPPQPSQNRTKQYCRRIHKTLDITECLCPDRAYCTSSAVRRIAPVGILLFIILARVAAASVL